MKLKYKIIVIWLCVLTSGLLCMDSNSKLTLRERRLLNPYQKAEGVINISDQGGDRSKKLAEGGESLCSTAVPLSLVKKIEPTRKNFLGCSSQSGKSTVSSGSSNNKEVGVAPQSIGLSNKSSTANYDSGSVDLSELWPIVLQLIEEKFQANAFCKSEDFVAFDPCSVCGLDCFIIPEGRACEFANFILERLLCVLNVEIMSILSASSREQFYEARATNLFKALPNKAALTKSFIKIINKITELFAVKAAIEKMDDDSKLLAQEAEVKFHNNAMNSLAERLFNGGNSFDPLSERGILLNRYAGDFWRLHVESKIQRVESIVNFTAFRINDLRYGWDIELDSSHELLFNMADPTGKLLKLSKDVAFSRAHAKRLRLIC